MEKTTIGILILLGVSIVGLIILLALQASVDALTPVITALLGFLAGNNKEAIAGIFNRKK